MRSRPSFSIALLLLGALLATFAHGPAVPRPVFAAGPTCTVGASGANYTTIQAAIDDPTCVTISVANGTYTEHLTINRDVTIQGVSAVSTIIDGEQGGLVVDIPSMAADVTLARLTVQHGQVQSGLADGISNRGMLTLNDSAVVDNLRSSQSNAAGIYNTGTLSIANSRLANNGIMNSAGVLNMINSLVEQSGIYNYGGTATISGSTIRGNDGSGITNTSFYQSNDGISFTPMLGQLSMTNSTISGNRGGLWNSSNAVELISAITLTNVTLANNTASYDGSSIYNYGANVVKLKNTIVAGGLEGANCNGPLTSLGYNIEDTNTCGLNGTGDHPNTNPQISPLRDNAGTWPTHALLPGSPAIDTGAASGCPTTDERGVARPKDGDGNGSAICDIGAFEYQFDPIVNSLTPDAIIAGSATFQITAMGANYVAGSTLLFNAKSYATTFQSSTVLKAQIDAADIALAGVAQVRVVGPDTKRSNLIPFTVNNPTPIISSLSPNFISPSGPPATLTITGANFVPGSVVRLFGFFNQSTTFVSSTQLRAQLDSDTFNQINKIDVTVVNPEPGGGASNILTLDVGVSYAGSIGGGVPTVAISGTLAYIGEGSELTILDISNPSAPARLGGFTTRERVQDIDLSGQRAYVTDALDGLLILNVADPAHPQLLGSYNTPGEAYDVQASGDRVYVADGFGGMRILDIGNPAQPVQIGYYPVRTYDLAVVGTTAYLATGDSGDGLVYLDVSNPANLIELSNSSASSTSLYYGVYVTNQRVYAAVGNDGFVIANLTYAGSTLGSLSGLGEVKDLTVVGNRAYLVNYAGTLHVVDVSNDAQPKLLGSYDTPGASWDVRVSGNRAYVADGPTGLLVLDVSNPQAIIKLGEYKTWQALMVRVVGNRAYIAGGLTGLQILDVADPAHPARLGGIATSGIIADVAVAENRAYLARRGIWNGTAYVGGGVEVVDIADPAHPISLSVYPIESVYRVQVEGSRIYAGASGGLYILDASPAGALTLVGALAAPTTYNDLKVVGTRAFVTSPGQSNGSVDLTLIDLANASAPAKLGSAACWTGAPWGYVDIVGNNAYVASSHTLCTIDIGDAAHPQLIASKSIHNSSAQIEGIQVIGSLAYLAESTLNEGALDIIDLSAPDQSPGWLSERAMSSHIVGLQIVGKLVYAATEEGGLQIVRVQPQLFSAGELVSSTGGSVANRDGSVVLHFPAAGIPGPLVVTYAGFVAPTQPLGALMSAGISFTFEARDQNGQLVTQLLKPYTMVVSYTDENLAVLGVNEADLNVAFWNGSAWVSLLPCAGCGVDTVNNRVTVVLDHFTEFALVSAAGNSGHKVYLPLMRR